MSPDELRALIARNGAGTRDFFLAGHPPDLMSPLFNMPARLVVGSHCYYEHAPDILRRAAAAVPAAELGRRAAEQPVLQPFVEFFAASERSIVR